MDFEALLKDAALFGLAVGVIAMAAFLMWACGQYLLRRLPSSCLCPIPARHGSPAATQDGTRSR